jgi:hypothetical protein
LTAAQREDPPEVTPADTVDEIVRASKRTGYFPIRREFLQLSHRGKPVAGPLGSIVSAGDLRALHLYLLLLTKASSPPWDARLPAAAWARALSIDLPTSKTARSTISKIWLRLEQRQLVERVRKERLADVFLLREDGSGKEYTNPGEVRDVYVRIPLALWLQGPGASTRWYQELTLPELSFLLIARTYGDRFRLPYEMGPDWYGISADTLSRGAHGLETRGLLEVDKHWKKAPLTAAGYTAENRYTLQPPFGPQGRRSGPRQGRSVSAAATGQSKLIGIKRTAKKRAAKKPTRTAKA